MLIIRETFPSTRLCIESKMKHFKTSETMRLVAMHLLIFVRYLYANHIDECLHFPSSMLEYLNFEWNAWLFRIRFDKSQMKFMLELLVKKGAKLKF